ncbi:Pycsar system effector family protein [Solibacillus sp. FSL R5-0449]|uniref:Pycsar system effector family protein n=1 Tax=Solibacillus sp. FSL R5-0449 TaxID=2921639 RepID=UPI0030CAA2AA
MGKIDNEKLFDYNKHNLVYISEYIKLADQKANILLTINIALIGFFANYLKNANLDENVITKVFLIIGVVILIISASIILIKILWPRYNLNVNEYMSWGGIAAHLDKDSYTAKIKDKEFDTFLKDMAEQNYALANVCKAKFKYLKMSTWFFSTGILVVGISWLLDK